MKRSKGFTLVEVLIVVVIIAILASLIMPRMLAQTEKAKLAEAVQMIGTIKRAAQRARDLRGSYPSGYAVSDFGYHDGDWGLIGLKDLGNAKSWGYDFWSDPEYGYLYVDAWYPEWSRYMYYMEDVNYPEGNGWYCDETFLTNDGDLSKPCRIK